MRLINEEYVKKSLNRIENKIKLHTEFKDIIDDERKILGIKKGE